MKAATHRQPGAGAAGCNYNIGKYLLFYNCCKNRVIFEKKQNFMKQGGRTISLQYTLVPELANYLPHCPKNNINQAFNDCIVNATVCTSICFLCRDSDSFLEVKETKNSA